MHCVEMETNSGMKSASSPQWRCRRYLASSHCDGRRDMGIGRSHNSRFADLPLLARVTQTIANRAAFYPQHDCADLANIQVETSVLKSISLKVHPSR